MSQSIISLTKKLISIPSTSGDEAEILSYISNWLADKNFEINHQTDQFCAGLSRKTGADRALILAGHIDTVGADPADWPQPPTQPVEKNGRIYGLGASDMKAGVAANLLLAAKPAKRQRDIWVVATAGEEIDGAGTAAFTKWFKQKYHYQQVDCLIAEPTGLQRVEIGHRGNRFVEVCFTGRAGHTSQPGNYDGSAIQKLQILLSNVNKIANQLEKFSDPLLGQPSLVPSSVLSGSSQAPNQSAPTATAVLDIRTTPALDRGFEEWFQDLSRQYDFTWRYIANPVGSALNRHSQLAAAITQSLPGVEITTSPGATDQRLFEQAGIPTVVFGPGEFSPAHAPNEYIEISKLEKYISVINKIVR